ncbi:MAG: AAA family ATPase, partial [Solirubrobacterales bacterium]|nr:AAA family ATPase [Solirubrobacterales bacterium]
MVTSTSTALVPRPVLIGLLEDGARGPVTVIAASAGSGKTLLVRSWLESDGRDWHAAWVSVERGERDAQRFWGAVVAELSVAGASVGVAIEAPQPTPHFDGEAVVERLLSELASLDSRLVLVLDDLHELAAPEMLAQVTYFLDRLPPSVHVVLISRRDPQLGLHRRRLAGELTEIRSEDLRFTLEETRGMLTGLGIAMSDE